MDARPLLGMRARVFAPDVLLRGMSGRVFGMRAHAFLSGIGSEFPFRKSIFYLVFISFRIIFYSVFMRFSSLKTLCI